MALLSKPTALFETIITETIDENDTTIPLNSLSDGQGSTLVNGATVALILDEGEDSGNADYGQEYIIGTVDTAGVRLTSCLRGVSLVDGVTEVAANKKKHRRGASAKMTTHPYLVRVIRILNGEDGIDPTALIKYSSAPTFTPGSQQLATIAYADELALSGSPNATTTTKGIVELATSAEATAGTATGGTGASLALDPATLAAQVQSGSWLYAVEDGTGSDDTYTAALTPALTAYTAGMLVMVKFTVANTGASTLNLNSLGAKSIKKYASGAKADTETGDIVANMACLFYYDGTDMVLLNPSAATLTSATLSEMSAFFAATDATGAEVEALTDGSETSLHKHPLYFANPGRTTDGSATTSTTTKTLTVSCGFVPVAFEAVVVLGIVETDPWTSGGVHALGQQAILIKGEVGGNVTWRKVAATASADPTATVDLDPWTSSSPSFGTGTSASPGTGTTNPNGSATNTFGLTSVTTSGNDLLFNFTFTKGTSNCGLRYGLNYLSVSNS